MSEKWIRASEISGYLYCRRSWYLKRMKGIRVRQTPEIRRGNRYHAQHGRMLFQSIWFKRAAYGLLFCLVTFLTFQILVSL